MNITPGKIVVLVAIACAAMLLALSQTVRAEDTPKIKTLMIVGVSPFHDPVHAGPFLKAAFESTGVFTVDMLTIPPAGPAMAEFKPDFTNYQVVVLNYNGPEWPEATMKTFEAYMMNGGGLATIHATDNSFPNWVEYNKMIGVGGWNGRNQNSGVMLRWRDGKVVREVGGPGPRGQHGARFSWLVETRDPDHPIMQGLPEKWLHTPDELYSMLAGPAENVTVLATAKSDTTRENEPILMVISYGKGRVFHSTMGHDDTSLKDVGFITTLERGAEWAATGKVTQKVPDNFPDATKTSVWTSPAN